MSNAIAFLALVVVGSGAPATNGASEDNGLDPAIRLVELRIDSMTFAAETLRFVETEAERDERNESDKIPRAFELVGGARYSIADGDVVIRADKLRIETNGSAPISVVGVGNCHFVDGEGEGTRVTAEKLELGREGLLFEGQVRVQCADGTVISADSIKSATPHDGRARWRASGTVEIILKQ